MAEKWHYRAGGTDQGPFSVEEMKERAARGDLGPDDLVWPEGSTPGDALPAEQAIPFPTLAAAPPAALPDWLEDVQTTAEFETSRPELPSADSIPGWLQELILQKEAAPAEELPGSEEAAAPAAEPSPEEVESAAAAFLFETPEEETSPSSTAGEVGAREISVEPEPAAPPPLSPETPRRPTESAQEIWRRARVALDRWIDLDANRDMVMAGDIDALQQDPDVRELIDPLQRFGPVMVDRLIQHLAFLAENRRKYYQALARREMRGEP